MGSSRGGSVLDTLTTTTVASPLRSANERRSAWMPATIPRAPEARATRPLAASDLIVALGWTR